MSLVPGPIQEKLDQIEILNLFKVQSHSPVVPWLEQNIVLPLKTAPNSAGPFRTHQRPYQRPILECWNPESGVTDCTVSAGTQMLKTTSMVLGVCYRIKHMPMPMLLVGSSKEWTKEEIGEKRLEALIDENEILAMEKPADPDKFRIMSMDMSGGGIKLVGGNSPGALSGGSYGIVAIDECAKLMHQQGEQTPEAHPMYLADKRTDGFGTLGFRWKSSTPNIPTHPFWQSVEAGDQTHFYCPCPHCGEYFYLDFMGRGEDREEYQKQLGISLPKDYRSLVWGDKARNNLGVWMEGKVRELTRYICPFNGCEITESQRQVMVGRCEEKRHNPIATKQRKSFILPSFYSPTMSLADMAWSFLSAQGDLFLGLQDYYNSRLARPFTQTAAEVKDDHVRKLREKSEYRRQVLPSKPYRLFMLADVGDYKTHWVVGALWDNDETAVIDWGTVLTPEELIPLSRKLQYPVAGTGEMISISRGLVDAKDQSVRVYDMCLQSQGRWFPANGSDSRIGTWGKQRLDTHRIDRYVFNSFALKKYLYVDLIRDRKSPRLLLPIDADEDLIEGLSGQKLMVVKGKEEFKKIPNDHYGDCVIRLQLAMMIRRAERGGTAPDMT